MSVIEFAEKVRKAAQDILGPEFYVETVENTKLNNVKLWSVNIHSKNANIAPVIYLESFYADYEEGKTFGTIMNEIIKIYWDYVPKEDYDFKKLLDFEYVKPRICAKLCNAGKNTELLKTAVYTEYLDLAVLYYIELDNLQIGTGNVTIRKEYAKDWGVSINELSAIALENSVRKFPAKLISMNEFFEDYLRKKPAFVDMIREAEYGGYCDYLDAIKKTEPMLWILTNSKQTNGSSAILYPGVIEEFAKKRGSNVFILPSSIHELILVPESCIDESGRDWDEKVDELKSMIAYVNDAEVSEGEFLSYSLYYYDKVKKSIICV